jgi:hypothetical protein
LRIERHRLRKLPVKVVDLDEQTHPAMRDPGNDLRDITCAPVPVKAPQSGKARRFPCILPWLRWRDVHNDSPWYRRTGEEKRLKLHGGEKASPPANGTDILLV